MIEKRVELNLGLVCNNSCRFCMNAQSARERKFVDARVIKRELRDLKDKGYNAVGFLGGEPTIYPGILDVAGYASGTGYRDIYMVTNGRKLSDKKFLAGLIESGIRRFNVSIHSHDARIEDYLTSVRGSFRQKIEGIVNLAYFRDRGLIGANIALNTVVNKRNYRRLARTMCFFLDNFGIKDFRFNFIRPEGRVLDDFEALVPRYEQAAPYLAEAISLSKKLAVDLSIEGVPFCFLRGVNDLGRVIGELRDGQRWARFGNKRRREFSVEQRRKNELKLKAGSCAKCFFDRYCEGPWKNYAMVYGLSGFRPITVRSAAV